MERARPVAWSLLAAIALLLSIGSMGLGCPAQDDFNSAIACGDYCNKNFQCVNKTPTSDETDTCVAHCRNSIENQCGNEHQAAANDQIETCVGKGCAEFWTCMVFSAAPDCYGFVTQ